MAWTKVRMGSWLLVTMACAACTSAPAPRPVEALPLAAPRLVEATPWRNLFLRVEERSGWDSNPAGLSPDVQDEGRASRASFRDFDLEWTSRLRLSDSHAAERITVDLGAHLDHRWVFGQHSLNERELTAFATARRGWDVDDPGTRWATAFDVRNLTRQVGERRDLNQFTVRPSLTYATFGENTAHPIDTRGAFVEVFGELGHVHELFDPSLLPAASRDALDGDGTQRALGVEGRWLWNAGTTSRHTTHVRPVGAWHAGVAHHQRTADGTAFDTRGFDAWTRIEQPLGPLRAEVGAHWTTLRRTDQLNHPVDRAITYDAALLWAPRWLGLIRLEAQHHAFDSRWTAPQLGNLLDHRRTTVALTFQFRLGRRPTETGGPVAPAPLHTLRDRPRRDLPHYRALSAQ